MHMIACEPNRNILHTSHLHGIENPAITLGKCSKQSQRRYVRMFPSRCIFVRNKRRVVLDTADQVD